jgi:hypothetical protein
MSIHLAQPDITPIRGDLYKLDAQYVYTWKHQGAERRITVPLGFEYDGASIPRILWTLVNITPDGLHRAAALIHDWIYRNRGNLGDSYQKFLEDSWKTIPNGKWERIHADRMFARLLREAEVPKFRRRIMYLAVRLLGWLSWKNT